MKNIIFIWFNAYCRSNLLITYNVLYIIINLLAIKENFYVIIPSHISTVWICCKKTLDSLWNQYHKEIYFNSPSRI